jgi:hypothetical protein
VLPSDPGAFAGLVIPQPNFFGVLEDVHALTDWAHDKGRAGDRAGQPDHAGGAGSARQVGTPN